MSILNKTKSDLPITTGDLIEYLDKTFPTQSITPSDTMPSIYYRSGQRSVIDFLKEKIKQET